MTITVEVPDEHITFIIEHIWGKRGFADDYDKGLHYKEEKNAEFKYAEKFISDYFNSLIEEKTREARIDELQNSLEAYNLFDDYQAKPNESLKAPNKYILNRLSQLNKDKS